MAIETTSLFDKIENTSFSEKLKMNKIMSLNRFFELLIKKEDYTSIHEIFEDMIHNEYSIEAYISAIESTKFKKNKIENFDKLIKIYNKNVDELIDKDERYKNALKY